MFVLFGLAWFALTQTAWGRHVYATGDDPEAARLTGIKTAGSPERLHGRRLMYGIAAWLLVSRTELGDPNAGRRPRTSTRSRPSSSAAPASSAAVGR
jgi:fructose transport system permease protein